VNFMSPSLDCDRVVVGSFEGEVSGSEFVVGVRLLGVARQRKCAFSLMLSSAVRSVRFLMLPASQ
jgi:hypothetical protein